MIKLILFLCLSTLSLTSWGAGIDDIYLQQKGKILKITSNPKITIIKKNSAEYFLNINNINHTINFKSEQSVQNLASIFPDRIFVILSFLNVKPNKKIYFDNEYLDATNEQGNADKYLYLDKGGHYKIQLKNMADKILDQADINIVSSITITCTNNIKMKCATK